MMSIYFLFIARFVLLIFYLGVLASNFTMGLVYDVPLNILCKWKGAISDLKHLS